MIASCIPGKLKRTYRRPALAAGQMILFRYYCLCGYGRYILVSIDWKVTLGIASSLLTYKSIAHYGTCCMIQFIENDNV
ncbi:MAG: hypothetical protein MJB12_13695 [Firmicutes bacterium]|nr:hypothetical protein [Bacillota bacterium]